LTVRQDVGMRQHPALRALTASAALCLSLTVAACGEDEAARSAEPTDATSSSRPSKSSTPAKKEQEPQEETGPTLEMTVTGDDVSPTGKAVELAAGDPLTIRITSDRPGELHVHASPEQYVEFGAGVTTRKLTVAQPGQVDVEEHETGALVARLLVK
jgi:hypothetical protein